MSPSFGNGKIGKKKKKGLLLVASIRPSKIVKEHNGWTPIRVLFRNDRKDVITVHEISVVNNDNLCITKATLGSRNPSSRPVKGTASDKLGVKWTVRPLLVEQSSEKFSSETLLFIGSTAHSMPTSQVKFRFKYTTASNSDLMITIDAVSEPINIFKIGDSDER